ncbi:MAG: FMN-binding protein [endosymbiont of Galathealinum brachiosum]|uniref:FMN-binding protein n=1 Tax=endosymbiont of Galathealinum brachiosum TaxID=2200906 RepID=A0A370DAE9_9GAMM|nr:MAG: FMN-binding protein [endosymbiont of Galathealinum brachiosum]
MIYKLIFLFLIISAGSSYAKGTYQQPEEFVSEAFTKQPEPQVVWIKGELRAQIENILQHKYKAKRIRYWQFDKRSVWVLEEIGKKKPITVGIIIDDNKISQLKVLVFRETRGWEVRYPFFTKQFNQLSLKTDNSLSETIDSISGATLSVRALRKLAQIALLLNKNTQQSAVNK